MDECVFNHGRTCSALTVKSCKHCPFRKTKEQLEEGRQKAKARIASLPEDIQRAIVDKYGFNIKDGD